MHRQREKVWLERAVIGLNLCPFAKSVHVKGLVHYAVSQATSPKAVLNDLVFELKSLAALDEKARDTTLLIVPNAHERGRQHRFCAGNAQGAA